jgi:rhomboid protease GluP
VNTFQSSKITFTLIALNVIAYLLVALKGGNIMNPGGLLLVEWGANFAPLTFGEKEIWRLLTSMFLHGSLMHLVINMYSLYSVGSMVEILCGKTRYLAIYILCGLIASATSLGFNMLRPHPGISIGASGAVFAIYGFFLVVIWLRKDLVAAAARQQTLQSGAIFIGINLFLGFISSGIDNAAHVGGLVSGVLTGLVIAPRIRIMLR